MSAVNLTELEKQVLKGINDSDYGETLGAPIWRGTERCAIHGKTLSGVFSSLSKKELIVCSEDGKDSTVYITALGIEICRENNLLGKFAND